MSRHSTQRYITLQEEEDDDDGTGGRRKNREISIPATHVIPSPAYPALQLHLYDPGSFVQLASA